MSRREKRYGNLATGWRFRTYPELLETAEERRQYLDWDKTRYIESALELYNSVVAGKYVDCDLCAVPALGGCGNCGKLRCANHLHRVEDDKGVVFLCDDCKI